MTAYEFLSTQLHLYSSFTTTTTDTVVTITKLCVIASPSMALNTLLPIVSSRFLSYTYLAHSLFARAGIRVNPPTSALAMTALPWVMPFAIRTHTRTSSTMLDAPTHTA